MTLHRAPLPRRNKRLTAVIAAAASISMLTAGVAVADSLTPDGDTLSTSPQLSYKLVDTPQSRLCSTRSAPVPGTLTIDWAGGQHLQAGEGLDIDVTEIPGVIIELDAADLTMPATWNSSSPDKVIDFTTRVAVNIGDGDYTVNFNATGLTSNVQTSGGSEQFKINVDCVDDTQPPANVPPSVVVTAPDSVNEGSTAVVTFAITDADSSAWTFVAGSPTCGTDATGHPGVVSAASIDNASKTGQFSCTYVDGVVPPQSATVSVQVNDGTDNSTVASDTIGVDNVAPGVSAPVFNPASVDCRSVATLTGISFADAGDDDDDWSVSIDWGDGSTDTVVTRSVEGAVPDQTHTYNAPGNFVATVTVTDKDGASENAATASGITVNQAYTIDFLPPFDDSSPETGLIVNSMKNGRTVPVKVRIFDVCAQAPVTDPTKIVTIKTSKTTSTGQVDTVESYADAGASSGNTNKFRWSADGFWIYNLDSTYLGLVVNNNYRIDVYVDGVSATTKSWAVLRPVK